MILKTIIILAILLLITFILFKISSKDEDWYYKERIKNVYDNPTPDVIRHGNMLISDYMEDVIGYDYHNDFRRLMYVLQRMADRKQIPLTSMINTLLIEIEEDDFHTEIDFWKGIVFYLEIELQNEKEK